MNNTFESLANQVLIAVPSLQDDTFARSMALICRHDAGGAMGVVLNRPSDLTLGDVFAQIQIPCDDAATNARVVLAGGPVHSERGFVVHDGEPRWESCMQIADDLCVTTSRDVLEAIARGEGPAHAEVALGCAGWESGQLESELGQNSWITAPADTGLLFEVPLAQRWQAAAARIGVDMARMPSYAGHA